MKEEEEKKEKEKKELEKIKRETQDALKKESKANLTKSIINANKDLNSENSENSENSVVSSSTSLSNSKTILTTNTINLEAKEDSDNESIANSDNQSFISSDYDSETESNANYTLKIDTLKDDKIASELNIQSLDDINKVDLDILELKSNISEEDDLALEIQELK